jgi:hypothetical protein
VRLDLVKGAKRHGRRRGAHDKKRDHHFEIVRRSESERICKYDPVSRSSCKLGRVGYMRLSGGWHPRGVPMGGERRKEKVCDFWAPRTTKGFLQGCAVVCRLWRRMRSVRSGVRVWSGA